MTVKHWDVTKTGNGEQGTSKGGWENEKCEQNRDFETKLLRRLGLKLGFFFPFFIFPFLVLVPCFSYILEKNKGCCTPLEGRVGGSNPDFK